MRIVADTNTLVSGFGWGGPPGQVVDTVLSGQVTLVTSPALLGELARVLAYPKLTAIFDDPVALVAAVAEAADTVDPAERVTVLADEPDNRVLEAAAAGRADLIVTGDKAMQDLASFLPRHPHRVGRPVRGTTPARSHRTTRPERAGILIPAVRCTSLHRFRAAAVFYPNFYPK